MDHAKQRTVELTPEGPQELSATELVKEIASKATLLVKKEVELARSELQEDIARELAMVKGFGVAAVAAIATVNLVLVAIVFALTAYMRPWIAALCVAAMTLAIALVAAMIAWSNHVREPLARTRKTLSDDVEFVKEELT